MSCHGFERNDQLPTPLMAAVIALIFAAGICTQKLGIFTIFGGFLLGLLFHKHRAFVEAWQNQIGQFVLVFFLPHLDGREEMPTRAGATVPAA